MLKLISKIFGGTKSEKDIKDIKPIVEEINKIYETLHNISDDDLKNKTIEFRNIILEKTKNIEEEKASLKDQLQNDNLSPEATSSAHNRLKEIENELFLTIQDVLDEILPEAYAVVKEVCKRLTDRNHEYVYADQKSTWAMVPYDVQLIGAIVLHQGKIAEMATGEGKTLVSTLALYLNSLPAKGVHLVTVNDYLAKRDCEWMKPIFDFLGISVGALLPKMQNAERKKIYSCDITYGTNNEFGFDYLRDNMVIEYDHMVQREHWFAIVDEVDSVLIDEARTPLIISGPVGKTDQKFDEMKPRVLKLVQAQNQLINKELSQVEELYKSGDKEKIALAGEKMLMAYKSLPKHNRLMKLKQDPALAQLLQNTELEYLKDHGERMRELHEKLYYSVDEKSNAIEISEMGRELITGSQEDPEMFVIPDIASIMSDIEGDENIGEAEKTKRIDEINILFAERSDRIHTVNQLLKAFSLFEKDIDYIVQDGKIQIVDENTGRVLDGRRYSDGLHQAIEAKENVKVEKDTQTFATITLQNYYRMYNKLAGMTGTAETEEAEFQKIYDLDVVVIPTNRPILRDDQDDVLYKTKKDKFKAIIDETRILLDQGRAVLIGTASVEVSELIARMFKQQGISHELLNAKQHQREAEIVALAGKKNAVTIATNMAGRGTDIKLDPDVKKNGGLAIIGSERHDSRRIDRQLRGRAGRQGDPGSSKFFISLEDDLMRKFGGDRSASLLSKINIPEGEPIQAKMMTRAVENAQKKVEENNFSIRKRLIDYDDVMNQQREVVYTRRRHALSGERLKGEIFEYIEDLASEWYYEFHEESLNLEGLKRECRSVILSVPNISEDEYKEITEDTFIDKIIAAADEFYTRKEELVGLQFLRQLEKVAFLQTIDDKWKEHLRVMEDLREGIHLRSYAQKDPIVEYKREAFEIFKDLIRDINKETVHFAFKYFPRIVEAQVNNSEANAPQLRGNGINANLNFSREDNMPKQAPQQSYGAQAPQNPEGNATTIKTIKRDKPKIGRNDLVKVRYPDGSIKEVKFKKVENEVAEGSIEVLD